MSLLSIEFDRGILSSLRFNFCVYLSGDRFIYLIAKNDADSNLC